MEEWLNLVLGILFGVYVKNIDLHPGLCLSDYLCLPGTV